jgi:hypothetical protein
MVESEFIGPREIKADDEGEIRTDLDKISAGFTGSFHFSTLSRNRRASGVKEKQRES